MPRRRSGTLTALVLGTHDADKNLLLGANISFGSEGDRGGLTRQIAVASIGPSISPGALPQKNHRSMRTDFLICRQRLICFQHLNRPAIQRFTFLELFVPCF